MAFNSVIALALLGILAQQAFGQFFANNFRNNFGRNNFRNNIGNRFGFVRPPPVYYTCIGKNSNEDEMRITITEGEQEQQDQGWWGQQLWRQQRRGLQLNSYVKLGPQSTSQGNFQLVLTTYGHVEDNCLGHLLGDIVDNRPWWGGWFQNRGRTETGRLGTPFPLSPSTRGYIADTHLDDFTSAREVNGRGMALCPVHYLSNGKCNAPHLILCCKVGLDSVNATTILQPTMYNQFNGGQQMPGQQMPGQPMVGGLQAPFGGQPNLGGQQNFATNGQGGLNTGAGGAPQPGGAAPLLGFKKK